MIHRPPATSSNNHTAASSNQDEEDDLPEELQRYGKDLVSKIENEIMESGDRITFDDIAGLDDQKQTVQEIVCWPMKRPDLFTGLRRAPNGLLLYGPPGEYTNVFACVDDLVGNVARNTHSCRNSPFAGTGKTLIGKASEC